MKKCSKSFHSKGRTEQIFVGVFFVVICLRFFVFLPEIWLKLLIYKRVTQAQGHTYTHTVTFFFLSIRAYPILSQSVCWKNIYFDLFYDSLCWGVQREIGMDRASKRQRVVESESCKFLILMTQWLRSMCHNLGDEEKLSTHSGCSLVPACFN